MQTLRRTVAVLTFPAIAYLGAACERMDTPTGVRPVAVVVASPTTLVVDDDAMGSPTDCNATTPAYPTISAAVAAASPGDVIKVCPGLYAEQVQINKTLTLLGAKAGVDARTRPPPLPTVESIIDHPCGPVQIEANNVVLDGFTVQGSILPDPCFLAGIWSNPGFTGTQGGHTILNNIVQNNISGIELDSDCTFPTLVQFNLIQNNDNPGPGSGNAIQTNFGLCKATVDNNKFSGHTNSSMLVVAPSSNLHVTNNELVGGTPEGIALLNTSTSSITGNVSIGSTNSFGTIDLFGGNSSVTIQGNSLLNGVRAIVVENPFSSFGVLPNSDITAHQNCIKGNSVAGMEVDLFAYPTTPQLNAENNWWGMPSGPMEFPRNTGGTGDKIIDPDQNVDFDPWLTSPPPSPCPAAPPPPNTPGKATGGGQIDGDPLFALDGLLLSLPALVPSLADPKSQATFGFVATCCTARGNLDYNDHPMDVRIKAQSVDGLSISSPGASCTATPGSKHATFRGMASVIRSTGTTTEPFTVDVDDCGEPGTGDSFSIKTTTYSNGPSPLIGGNIQIH